MTELEKAIAIISAASGAESTAVAEQLKSDEAPQSAATKLFEVKFTEQRDQGDQRATKKTRSEVEKALREAGVPDAKFSDLSGAIATLTTKAAEEAGKGITPEAALAHPAVKQKLNELTTATEGRVKEAVEKVKTDFETERTEFTQKQATAKKATLAEGLLTTLNPVLGDASKAPLRKSELIKQLAALSTVEVNGELFEADANGDVKPDALGNPVKYADLVRRETEARYDLPTSTEKENAGNRQEHVAAGAAGAFVFKEFKGAPPKTEQEYVTHANDPNLAPAALKELKAYWTTQASK